MRTPYNRREYIEHPRLPALLPSLDMAARLEGVRKRAGDPPLTEFRRRLLGDGDYEVSYQAVQNYHFDRPAPVDYLARVAEVFGADFKYLATGHHEARTSKETPMLDEWLATESTLDSGRWMVLMNDAEAYIETNSRFFWPIEKARRSKDLLFPSLVLITDKLYARAGRPGPLADPEDVPPEEILKRFQHITKSLQLLDDVFATAWEGMREIVAHVCGRDGADAFTLAQQIYAMDGMLLVLSGLFPDYGDPAAFKERRESSAPFLRQGFEEQTSDHEEES